MHDIDIITLASMEIKYLPDWVISMRQMLLASATGASSLIKHIILKHDLRIKYDSQHFLD